MNLAHLGQTFLDLAHLNQASIATTSMPTIFAPSTSILVAAYFKTAYLIQINFIASALGLAMDAYTTSTVSDKICG
jgi:hypothetical protein